MGSCPIYGHKYFSVPPQTYSFGCEIREEKREIDYNLEIVLGRETTKAERAKHMMDPSQLHVVINEVMFQKLYTHEWEEWLRYQRLDPPTDAEILNNKKAKDSQSLLGNAVEKGYRNEPGRKLSNSTVFAPQSEYSSVGTAKDKKDSGLRKDGIDEAEVEGWDPSKM